MILIREKSDDTLTGNIDGSNTTYYTSFDFDTDTVNVYVNGVLRVADLDNGFTVTSPNQVDMKVAPESGDTLEVEYQSDGKTGGGAEGGVPTISSTDPLTPLVIIGD